MSIVNPMLNIRQTFDIIHVFLALSLPRALKDLCVDVWRCTNVWRMENQSKNPTLRWLLVLLLLFLWRWKCFCLDACDANTTKASNVQMFKCLVHKVNKVQRSRYSHQTCITHIPDKLILLIRHGITTLTTCTVSYYLSKQTASGEWSAKNYFSWSQTSGLFFLDSNFCLLNPRTSAYAFQNKSKFLLFLFFSFSVISTVPPSHICLTYQGAWSLFAFDIFSLRAFNPTNLLCQPCFSCFLQLIVIPVPTPAKRI